MRQRHLCIIFAALILSLLAYTSFVLFSKPQVAHASAYVIGSDPVDSSTIASAPREVRIYFNAPINRLSSVHVLVVEHGSLVEVRTNPSVVSGTNANELIIPLEPRSSQDLPQGSYLVQWVAVANEDGRTTLGNIGFNVGISSTGLSGTPTLGPSTSNSLEDVRALDLGHPINILIVMWEWAMIAALTLWIGIVVMEQFVLSDEGRCTELRIHTKKRATALQRLCLVVLLFSEVVSLILRTANVVENTQPHSLYLPTLQRLLFDSDYGHFWLVRVGLILVAIGLLYWTNRTRQEHVEPEPISRIPRAGSLRAITSSGEEGVGGSSVQAVRPAATLTRTRTGTSPRTGATEVGSLSGIGEEERRYVIVWLVLSGLVLLMLVLSRAPAQNFEPHVSAILFDWLNLGALGIWFGSFVYLGYLILPLFDHKELEYHTETLTTVLRRLIPYIAIAISIEVISTLFLSEAAISQPQQLISDPYGLSLLFQIAFSVIMLALSQYALQERDKPPSLHARLKRQILFLPLVHADLPVRRLRQSELRETKRSLHAISIVIAWLGVGSLLCVALMAFFTPPIHFPNISYSNQSIAPTNTQTQQIGTLSVSLQLLPGRINETNTVILVINDKNGKPVTDAQVRVSINMLAMDMGTQSTLIVGGNPVYITTLEKGSTFNMAGLWAVNVEIERANQGAVQGTFQVMIA